MMIKPALKYSPLKKSKSRFLLWDGRAFFRHFTKRLPIKPYFKLKSSHKIHGQIDVPSKNRSTSQLNLDSS